MNTKDIIRHKGVVSKVSEKEVVVDIERSSACSACHAKSTCLSFDTHTQQIHCANVNYDLKVGDVVDLTLEKSLGVRAVMLAFVVPLLLLLLVIICFGQFFDVSEGIAALSGIGAIAIYYFILHLFDKKITNKIKFNIEKI